MNIQQKEKRRERGESDRRTVNEWVNDAIIQAFGSSLHLPAWNLAIG